MMRDANVVTTAKLIAQQEASRFFGCLLSFYLYIKTI